MLVAEGDARSWARTVVALIGDPARRAAMGAAGLAKVERFAWPRVAEQILGVYEEVTR